MSSTPTASCATRSAQGCSGGSINQLTASSIYPGLLDGIQPSCTYSDSETTGIEVADCELLVRFYASAKVDRSETSETQTVRADNAKQAAINGHLDQNGCRSWFNSFIGVARPGNYLQERVGADGTITTTTLTNNCRLPAGMVYDRTANPTGARCTGQDSTRWSILGHDRRSGAARAEHARQHGRGLRTQGVPCRRDSTARSSSRLNESVGGADFDIQHTDARSAADTAALDIAYKTGIVKRCPPARQDPDHRRPWLRRAGHPLHLAQLRIARAARRRGRPCQSRPVAITGALTPPGASGLTLASFLAMDKWLAAIQADPSGAPREQRVIANKPTDDFDFCYLSIDTKFQVQGHGHGVCAASTPASPRNSSPRQVAGGPITEDIFKCQLKPFNAADYPGLTGDQATRLAAVFTAGVCDWSKPGVSQQSAVSPRDFTAGPGGVPLPAAPVSRAQ